MRKRWSFEGGVRGKGSFEEGGDEREDGICMRVVEGVEHWRSG